jgi:hypothetical protein
MTGAPRESVSRDFSSLPTCALAGADNAPRAKAQKTASAACFGVKVFFMVFFR